MKTEKVFTIGKNKITFVSSNFKEWFYGLVFTPKKTPFESRQLERNMLDQEILESWQPEKATLGELAFMLTTDKLLTNSYANIFYIEDKKGVLRAVFVRWDVGGWFVFACPVDDSDPWREGGRVFSRQFGSLTSPTSTPSSLEARIAKLEQIVEGIRKVIK